MPDFDFLFPSRLATGIGAVERIGRVVRDLDAGRAFVLADRDSWAAGHLARVVSAIEREGLTSAGELEVSGASTLEPILGATALARAASAHVIVGVGNESVLDVAKAVAVLLPNGGSIVDYDQERRAARGGVPAVAVPSLLSAGAEARRSVQVYAESGEVGIFAHGTAGFAAIVLDAELSAGTPRQAIAASAIDATTHAVEAWVSTRRTVMSDLCAREAWRLLAGSFLQVLTSPDDMEATGAILVGSFLASIAAEHSALGAVHACARPVSRRYGVAHGPALALLLPEVVRWNSRIAGARYAELAAVRGEARRPEALVARLEDLVAAGEFPNGLASAGVIERELPVLAAEASADAMGEFNPRKFDVAGALEIYAAAY
jgi:alcohol dehydrogenase class IV